MRDLEPGTVVDGRYIVAERLGEGGFATVWRATDPRGLSVALKVLKPDRGSEYDPNTRMRFQREVSILAQLRDPHTVRLLGHGEDGGKLFMVFEYVPGADVIELLEQRGRLSPAEVEHIIRQVLSSLREAHTAGLVHRDIKPQNIRVFDFGGDPLHAKLLDFGIARPMDRSGPKLTQTGHLMGTPRYMSPEQLRGVPVTPASDIYTLGVVAFELLAGAQALPGSSIGAQLERMHTGHMFSVPDLADATPLMAVVQRMTAKEPGDRFQSAQAVLHALDHPPVVEPKTVSRNDNADEHQTPAPDGLRRAKTSAAILSLLVLLVGGVAVFLAVQKSKTQPTSGHVEVGQVPSIVNQPATPTHASDGGALDHERVVDASLPVAPPLAREGAVPSPGCGQQPSGTELADSFVITPAIYRADSPLPLVVMLHTDYLSPTGLLGATGFVERASADSVLLLAVRDGNDFGGDAWRDGDADAQKVIDAIKDVAARYCIDRSRIFVLGHGDGVRAARLVACNPGIAAFAANGFSLEPRETLCKRPVPTLWLHPLRSHFVPKSGKNCNGNAKRSLQEMESLLRKRNGCRGPTTTTFSQGESLCEQSDCTRARFEICHVDGGVPWPGTHTSRLATLSGECQADDPPDFPTSDKVWEFFKTAPPLDEVPEEL